MQYSLCFSKGYLSLVTTCSWLLRNSILMVQCFKWEVFRNCIIQKLYQRINPCCSPILYASWKSDHYEQSKHASNPSLFIEPWVRLGNMKTEIISYYRIDSIDNTQHWKMHEKLNPFHSWHKYARFLLICDYLVIRSRSKISN